MTWLGKWRNQYSSILEIISDLDPSDLRNVQKARRRTWKS
jgi:hypothetical protein